MKVKYLTKYHEFDLKDLKEETIDGLRAKIKELVPECANLPENKVLLFYNKMKIVKPGSTSLAEINVTNDSLILILLLARTETNTNAETSAHSNTASSPHKNGNTQHKPSGTSNNASQGFNPFQGTPNMFNGFPQAGYNNADASGFEQQMIDQLLKDPDAMLPFMEAQMANLTEDQKALIRQQIDTMKKNPEVIKQMLNNPAIMNAIRNPAMMSGMQNPMMGGMQNPMMGGMQNPMMNGMQNPMMNGMPSPMMGGTQSPMMGEMQSPMMNNPMMHYPMMNGMQSPVVINGCYYYPMNPMMNQMSMQTPPPANGPCSHGFYPLVMVNGKPEPQNLETIYAEKLVALNEMGFYDKEANIKALTEAKGDISEAIDILSKKLYSSK